MHDYVYPSIFLAYFMFFLFVVGAAFFLVRSARHGYWGKRSEEPKYRMLADDDSIDTNEPKGQLRRHYGGTKRVERT